MTENKTMDSIHKGLLKKFHTLCSVLGMTTDEKYAIVYAYGVESSRDLDTHDLVNICGRLSSRANDGRNAEMERLRRQCMASIGQWLRVSGRESNASVIKGIACRATRHDEFNKIPKERLRNLVYLFNNKVKDRDYVDEACATADNVIKFNKP